MMVNKDVIFFWSLIICVYVAAWIIQDGLFLNWDVSILLSITKRLLAGGTYTNDFFSPNPPLILFLSSPPILVSKLFNSDLVTIFRIYIFLLASLSIGIGYSLMQQVWTKENRIFAYLLTIVLAALFLILPSYEFGQREHLLVILTMPYLLLMADRLNKQTNKLKVRPRKEFFIGLLAAMGFVIKPYFLVTPILIECYYASRQRNWFAWLRPEVIAIISFIVIYILSIFIFYPDYIYTVLPFLVRNYGRAVGGYPLSIVLQNPNLCFCLFAVILSFSQRKENSFNQLNIVLVMALLGFVFSYIIHRTATYYHILPAFTLAVLLVFIAFISFITKPMLNNKKYMSLIVPSIFFFAFIYLKRDVLRIMLGYAAINLFFLADIILIIVVYLSYNLKILQTKSKVSFNAVALLLGIILFIYPVGVMQLCYWKGIVYKKLVLNNLVLFMKKQPPHQSIAVFSTDVSYGAPLIDYTDSRLTKRFECLWPIRVFLVKPSVDENTFLNFVTDDLHDAKPDLVFVDMLDRTILFIDANNNKSLFNYINYFSRSLRFREEWKKYQYVTTLELFPYFKLEVYRRRV